ncbi:hypothetical protein DICA3_A07294 [Diutina catenulata]
MLTFIWTVFVLLPLRVLRTAWDAAGGRGSRFRKYKHDPYRSGLLELAGQALRVDPIYHWMINLRPSTLLYLLERNHSRIAGSLPDYGTFYDAHSYWLVKQPDRVESDPIVIYLHGGAFTFQATPNHLEAIVAIQQLVTPEKQRKLSILVVNYKLAGHGYPNPIQLKQLGQTYENLVRENNNNFILLGDSAGATLAITHLQQLRANQKVLPLPFPKAVILVSPWVKLYPDVDDYKPGNAYFENSSRDYLSWTALKSRRRLRLVVGDSKVESLTISPGNCPPNHDDWMIPTLENAFVSVGEDELLRDDTLEFCQYALGVPVELDSFRNNDSKGVLQPQHEYLLNKDRVQLHVEPWGVHDSILLEGSDILSELNDGKRPSDISAEKYFTIPKVAAYLDRVL